MLSKACESLFELTRIVSTLDGAVLGARRAIRASSGVPGVAIEAVGVPGGNVSPTPVGVEGY